MKTKKNDSSENENALNERCGEIFKELERIAERLNWTRKEMILSSYAETHEEEEEEERYYQTRKKMLGRKNWEKGKANRQTLVALETLREGVFRTERYREKGKGGLLDERTRKSLRRASQELERKLKQQDWEE